MTPRAARLLMPCMLAGASCVAWVVAWVVVGWWLSVVGRLEAPGQGTTSRTSDRRPERHACGGAPPRVPERLESGRDSAGQACSLVKTVVPYSCYRAISPGCGGVVEKALRAARRSWSWLGLRDRPARDARAWSRSRCQRER